MLVLVYNVITLETWTHEWNKFTWGNMQNEAMPSMFCSLEKVGKPIVKSMEATQSQENIHQQKLLMIPSVVFIW